MGQIKKTKISKVLAYKGISSNGILSDVDVYTIDTKYGIYVFADDVEISSQSIFVVLKNSDFTEGRSPMRPTNAFIDIGDAIDFIMKQGGIYGSEQYMQLRGDVRRFDGTAYCYTEFNGYDIKVMELK